MDQIELFLRLVFCFLTGNSDMHLKNFLLIETAEGSRKYILSPAYDLLPVNLIMPQDKEEFALPMNGRKNNLQGCLAVLIHLCSHCAHLFEGCFPASYTGFSVFVK